MTEMLMDPRHDLIPTHEPRTCLLHRFRDNSAYRRLDVILLNKQTAGIYLCCSVSATVGIWSYSRIDLTDCSLIFHIHIHSKGTKGAIIGSFGAYDSIRTLRADGGGDRANYGRARHFMCKFATLYPCTSNMHCTVHTEAKCTTEFTERYPCRRGRHIGHTDHSIIMAEYCFGRSTKPLRTGGLVESWKVC
jgi:hypothetical protein